MYHKFKRELILKTFSIVLLQGWMVCANMCFVNHLKLTITIFETTCSDGSVPIDSVR